jgi:hypothetical protein
VMKVVRTVMYSGNPKVRAESTIRVISTFFILSFGRGRLAPAHATGHCSAQTLFFR